MSQLILLRHGQSVWNKANIFTGWVDVPLSDQGIDEALSAGEELADIEFDCIFMSTLMRAQQTAMLAMSKNNTHKTPIRVDHDSDIQDQSHIYCEQSSNNMIPVHVDWRLNERNYGQLQGYNKQATAEEYGEEQVKLWRRSYDVAPPEGESLEMTSQRTLPCLFERIQPMLERGLTCLVSAHGNSLRSIVQYLDDLSQDEVLQLEISTGVPFYYQFEAGKYYK